MGSRKTLGRSSEIGSSLSGGQSWQNVIVAGKIETSASAPKTAMSARTLCTCKSCASGQRGNCTAGAVLMIVLQSLKSRSKRLKTNRNGFQGEDRFCTPLVAQIQGNQMKIFTADMGTMELADALEHLTDTRITNGIFCDRTVRELREACKILIEDRKNLVRFGERAGRALMQEGVRTKVADELLNLIGSITVRG